MSVNNNPFNTKILANMNTQYSPLIKAGATGIGNDAMSKSIFAQFDKDQNGMLSQYEIDSAMPSFQDILKDAAASFKDLASNLFGGNKVADNPPDTIPENTNEPNGKIDKDFKQGETGDCWLLSAIAAKASTPEGLEELNNMLKKDDNGNITVYIENQSYTITKEELEAHTELSSGDMDVRAIELAVDKHTSKAIDDGGSTSEMFTLLSFGKEDANTKWRTMEENSNLALDILKHNNTSTMGKQAMVVGTDNTSDLSNIKAFDENGNQVELYNGHGYAAIKADDKYVYLKNPHDTSKTLRMSHEDFKKAFQDFGTQQDGAIASYLNVDTPSKIEEIKLNFPE